LIKKGSTAFVIFVVLSPGERNGGDVKWVGKGGSDRGKVNPDHFCGGGGSKKGWDLQYQKGVGVVVKKGGQENWWGQRKKEGEKASQFSHATTLDMEKTLKNTGAQKCKEKGLQNEKKYHKQTSQESKELRRCFDPCGRGKFRGRVEKDDGTKWKGFSPGGGLGGGTPYFWGGTRRRGGKKE